MIVIHFRRLFSVVIAIRFRRFISVVIVIRLRVRARCDGDAGDADTKRGDRCVMSRLSG